MTDKSTSRHSFYEQPGDRERLERVKGLYKKLYGQRLGTSNAIRMGLVALERNLSRQVDAIEERR